MVGRKPLHGEKAIGLAAGQVIGRHKMKKHIDPIRHWNDDRIRAHVFLCMLAYYVEWHMRDALRKLIFDDEDIAGLR